MYRGSKNNACSAAVGSLINTSHSRSLESTSDHLCEEAPVLSCENLLVVMVRQVGSAPQLRPCLYSLPPVCNGLA